MSLECAYSRKRAAIVRFAPLHCDIPSSDCELHFTSVIGYRIILIQVELQHGLCPRDLELPIHIHRLRYLINLPFLWREDAIKTSPTTPITSIGTCGYRYDILIYYRNDFSSMSIDEVHIGRALYRSTTTVIIQYQEQQYGWLYALTLDGQAEQPSWVYLFEVSIIWDIARQVTA